MDKEIILKSIKAICDLSENELKNIEYDADLSHIGLDSIKFIQFIVLIEEEFNIEINDSDLLFSNFDTINKVFETLSKYFEKPRKLKKCLILDCDNVLWKGISGEEKIVIDSDVFKLQNLIIDLYSRGVLICLCSKNEPEFINYSLNMPKMLINEEYITIQKINRNDKASNISEISKELNLTIDSFVFVDDSDYELGFVESILPEITVIKADYNNIAFIDNIKSLFDEIKEADINRTKLYKEQKEREKSKYKFQSIEEYNCSLKTTIICDVAGKSDLLRLCELSQRTNQFNLSDKHYKMEELQDRFNDSMYSIISLSASDIYGDMGIVGMAVLKENIIETFMLSCRVFGRGFENLLLDKVKAISPSGKLLGCYKCNGKNIRYKEFYNQNGVKTI